MIPYVINKKAPQFWWSFHIFYQVNKLKQASLHQIRSGYCTTATTTSLKTANHFHYLVTLNTNISNAFDFSNGLKPIRGIRHLNYTSGKVECSKMNQNSLKSWRADFQNVFRLVNTTRLPTAMNMVLRGSFPTSLAAIGAAINPPIIRPATSVRGIF